ncbi:MAG: hypothetical protein UY14_C0030G0001 [Parcubacteria group bacterium GW2011_GWA1_47_9]|nr:MAG: hypothetical protein UY14_C0030G0001 [Parcubacteria group bacterium GW2011_GWA1_47_9]
MPQNAEEVFESLRRSSAYNYSCPVAEKTKREIFTAVWRECSVGLKSQYGFSGVTGDDTGFGYLVEEFARCSLSVGLAPNSQTAANLERLFLYALRTGDRSLLNLGRLCNPDLLWIECRGRRAEIVGMGEVKASAGGIRNSKEQIGFQESSIRTLTEKIREEKKNGTASQCFKQWRISVSQNFRKVLILPLGQTEFVRDIPAEGFLGRYERLFLKPLLQWGKERLAFVFYDDADAGAVSDELFFFSFTTAKLPLDDIDVELAKKLAGGLNPSSVFLGLVLPELRREDLTAGEKKFLDKFLILFGEEREAERFILLFLSNQRRFSKKLAGQIRKHKEASKIRTMENVNFLVL